jgi:hypothetical protein
MAQGLNRSIPVSEKHGINPALVKCQYCGKNTDEIVLVGRGYAYKCLQCGVSTISYSAPSKCDSCGGSTFLRANEEFDGSRGIVCGTCDECSEKIQQDKATMSAVVEAGGVYWKCEVCGASGAIKASAFARQVRKAAKVPVPKPCEVTLDHTHEPKCPVFSPLE